MHECLLTKCTICTPYAHHMHHTHSIALAENETFCGIPSGIPICFGTRGQWAMLRFKSKRFFNLSWTRRKLVNRNLNHHKPPKAILQFWTIAWLILSHLRALPALAPQRQFPQNRWASCTGCCLSGPTRGRMPWVAAPQRTKKVSCTYSGAQACVRPRSRPTVRLQFSATKAA